MKALRVLNLPLLAILLTSLPFGAFAQSPTRKNAISDKATQEQTVGGSNGGGGYQYPNSKLLLEVVSEELAEQIAQMHPQAFSNFPKKLDQKALAKIIRNVVAQPNVYTERKNKDGKMEGLMFDYKDGHIIALKPFYDAYKGTPTKQHEAYKRKFGKYEKNYELIRFDVRERLLHEAGHLLDIGITAQTDANGDVFAERVDSALHSQFIVCHDTGWVAKENGPNEHLFTRRSRESFLINTQSGYIKLLSTISLQDNSGLLKKDSDYLQQAVNSMALKKYSSDNLFHTQGEDSGLTVEPKLFTRKDGQVQWQGSRVDYQLYLNININLATGHGIRDIPVLIQISGTKGLIYETRTMNYDCSVVSPSISLEFN